MQSIPYLRKHGSAIQLIVRDKPFLILGGELGNSSASDLTYLETVWPKVVALNLNTVLAPVYWELLEPEEGRFDFFLVDGLIRGARRHGLSLVLLWFGAWKSSMSCYAPLWVKRDFVRFPCMVDALGRGQEILSAFSPKVFTVDTRAFTALMAHLKEIDGQRHTVIMIQVENKIGMLPCTRDMSETANRLYTGAVPEELLTYLATCSTTLVKGLRARWEAAGKRMAGTWEEVFSPGEETEEFFMAWHYAAFVDRLAAAGFARIIHYCSNTLIIFPFLVNIPSFTILPNTLDKAGRVTPNNSDSSCILRDNKILPDVSVLCLEKEQRALENLQF